MSSARQHLRPLPPTLIALLAALLPAVALAVTPVCVETRALGSEEAGLRKLVLDELAHHPTHQLVEADCPSRLVVELFRVGTARYLTARINQEVPVRYELADEAELARRLSEGLQLVLRHDPVYLSEDITELDLAQRAAHSVLKRGHNRFRLELFQVISRTDQDPAFAGGVAAALRRGADHWQVQARLAVGGTPEAVSAGSLDDRALRLFAGADTGILYEFSRLGQSSLYVGGGAGLLLLRYEGYLAARPRDREELTRWGGTLDARVGWRTLRYYDFDLDVFVQGVLPLFVTRHVDSPLFGEDGVWTPSVQLGLGVGF